MLLDETIYDVLSGVEWFGACGNELAPTLPFRTHRLHDRAEAITNACSSNWKDIGTAAQGELTGFLAKHHYDSYGGHWNRLAQESRERVMHEIMPSVNSALEKLRAIALSDIVLLDLNRIALQSAYAKRFRRVPDFYRRLLAVYERGHLPCGWVGALDMWPEGQLIIY